MRPILLALLIISLTGCAAFNREDTYATLEVEHSAFATEIMVIRNENQENSETISQDIATSEALIAMERGVNLQLIGTLERAVTPTPGLIIDQSLNPTIEAEFGGRRYFQKTGMSLDIRPEDGCVTVPNLSFPVSSDRIYATARVQNIESGVPLASKWYYEEELVYEFDFVTDSNHSDWCFYFYIDPDIVEFRPGSWSVRLFADGFQLEEPMSFTMTAVDEMDMMDE